MHRLKYYINMRMYVYLDKNIIKKLAPRISDISFDIDFFEYSEKRGYTTNNNTSIRPDFEKECRKDCKEENMCNRKRVGISEDMGTLCNIEVIKRFINIEDVSSIKNNNFYYSIIEKIPEDNRIKIVKGIISNLTKSSFFIDNYKFVVNEEAYNELSELFDNICEVKCLGYKINCLNSDYDVFKAIAIYIE